MVHTCRRYPTFDMRKYGENLHMPKKIILALQITSWLMF